MKERKNAEFEKKVIAAYQKKVKLADICKKFGITSNDIYNILSHNNIHANRYNNEKISKQRKITPDDEKDIITMYKNKIRTKDISEKYNVSDNTILRLLRRNGVDTSCGYRIYRYKK